MEYGKDADVGSREMGQSGSDCRFSPEVRKRLRLSIECKKQEKWNINQFVEQAKKQAGDLDWVVIVSRNYQKEPFVVIPWKLFLEFIKYRWEDYHG